MLNGTWTVDAQGLPSKGDDGAEPSGSVDETAEHTTAVVDSDEPASGMDDVEGLCGCTIVAERLGS